MKLFHIYFAGLSFLLGASLASFTACMVYRYSHHQSILTRSHCDDCGEPVGFIGLIPVLGWFVYGGRCRRCGHCIPMKYPIQELIMGTTFAWLYWKTMSANFELAYCNTAIFVALTAVIGIVDYEIGEVPYTSWPFFAILGVLGLISRYGTDDFVFTIIVAIVYTIFLYLMGDNIGGGDIVIIVTSVGVFGPITSALALVFGGVAALVFYFVFKRNSSDSRYRATFTTTPQAGIRLVPYLALGMLIVM